MADPVKFPVAYRERFEPDPDVVRYCEAVLEQAKSGKLRALAVAAVYHDDLTADAIVDRGWTVPRGMNWALDTAISRLAHKWRQLEYDGEVQMPAERGG